MSNCVKSAGRRGESGVGVHEIEPFALHAIEQHGAFGGIDGIPAYVGHHVGIESAHLAVNELQPRRVKVMLGATGEHDLLTHAHAEHRAPRTQTVVDHVVAIHLAQSLHAGTECAHARYDETVGLQGLAVIGGERDVKVLIGECAHHGAHIADP